MVDRIENEIYSAKVNVIKGKEELNKADEYAKAKRKKMIFITAGVTVVILILTIIVLTNVL